MRPATSLTNGPLIINLTQDNRAVSRYAGAGVWLYESSRSVPAVGNGIFGFSNSQNKHPCMRCLLTLRVNHLHASSVITKIFDNTPLLFPPPFLLYLPVQLDNIA